MDGNGNKMSKSLGNGIDPNKIILSSGADILRLWVATVDYQADVRISSQILSSVQETYRKIRNTFKFLLANLSDGDTVFDYDKNRVTSFSLLGQYMLASLEKTKNEALNDYNNYDFASAIQTILTFLVNDVSAFYASISKDSLYCDEKNSPSRKEYQTVFYTIIKTLSILLAPVLCFTMDEVYQNLPSKKYSHIALEDMVKESHEYDNEILNEFSKLKDFRNVVNQKLEEARSNGLIGSSLEAMVNLKVNQETYNLLNKFTLEKLQEILIVSKVNLELNENNDNLIEVSKVKGEKCPRCWSYHETFVEFNEMKLCKRCYKVVKDVAF